MKYGYEDSKKYSSQWYIMMINQNLSNMLDLDYRSERTIILIPSISFSGLTHKYLIGLNYFEERNLFYLACLVNPKTRFVAVLSDTIDENFVRYCVAHVCTAYKLDYVSVEKRFEIVRIPIANDEHLSNAILSHPGILSKLRITLKKYSNPVIDFWLVSEHEIELANKLNIPYHGMTTNGSEFDNKSSARKLFREISIPIPRGEEQVMTVKDAWSALKGLEEQCAAASYLIKLNSEEAGNGIAVVPQSALSGPFDEFLTHIKILKDIPCSEFIMAWNAQGATIEEYITATIKACPSVKMEILSDGSVRNLATHDQILRNMAHAGSQFPANADYRQELIQMGGAVARAASEKGARGIISVDFLATKNDESDPWSFWGIEINARKGATTHPNFWSRWLTGAVYSEESGRLMSRSGEIIYKTSEYFSAPNLDRVKPKEILESIKKIGIDYDADKQSGVFVHMLSCVRDFSKIGATVIGHSNNEISEKWDLLEELLERLALACDEIDNNEEYDNENIVPRE